MPHKMAVLRYACWNANGLAETKLGLAVVAKHLRGFHIIAISEKRCKGPPPASILQPEVFGHRRIDAERGRNGEGLLVLWAKYLTPHIKVVKISPKPQAVWLRLSKATKGLDRPLFVGAVYVVPWASGSHGGAPAETQAVLQAQVGHFRAREYVLIMGDLNARVGSVSEQPDEGDMALLSPAARELLCCPRRVIDQHVNAQG